MLLTCVISLQQLWRYNKHAVEMRIAHLNSTIGTGTEAQTVMVNDIPEVNKVCFVTLQHATFLKDTDYCMCSDAAKHPHTICHIVCDFLIISDEQACHHQHP